MHDQLIREAYTTYANIFRKHTTTGPGCLEWHSDKAQRVFLKALRRCQRRRRSN